MKHAHQIIPVSDAQDDVSDWWQQTFDPENERGAYVEALYDTTDDTDSYTIASGANGYRHVDRDVLLHNFIGLTVEDRDDIRFVDLHEFVALGAAHGFDASALIGEWQDRMDRLANE